MAHVIDVLLLLALPASGKSEVRRYLTELPPEVCRDEFHLGRTVHLGDYSYVHMMRRVSRTLRALGQDGVFFDSDDLPFKDSRDWGTLTELINEDHADLVDRRRAEPDSATEWLLDRFDAARAACGAEPVLCRLSADAREQLVLALEAEAQDLLALKNADIPATLDGCTVVIEMARGGPDQAVAPLPAPLGYQYSLSRLSDDLLSRASILNVWATPEQSRRKNAERAGVGAAGDQSVLHHGVPLAVLLSSYGMDDMDHLIRSSGRPDAVRIETRGRTYTIPAARFDNRVDRTTFLRGSRNTWPAASVSELHDRLTEAFDRLVRAGAPMKDCAASDERRAA